MIDAAAAVSAPLDLTACGHHLAHGFNRVYSRHFLRSLKQGAAERLASLACSMLDGCCVPTRCTRSTLS